MRGLLTGTRLGLILGLLSGSAVYANPEGANVVRGQVNFNHPDPSTLNITNSNGAIINWQDFSIQQNEITRFIQHSASSAILNRVTGQDPSSILGQLLSNGRVFVINPNGIIFGQNSVVDTAGLIASTLDMTDEDFIAGNLKFQGDNAGAIQSMGYIKAGANGDIFLIAPNIENSGIIETQGGQIMLAAGESITIASLDSDHIVFDVQAPDNEVVNLGEIITRGGAASMFAATIKHSGSINANSISVDANGKVRLFARNDIEISTNATITANGTTGGEIRIKSESGTVWQSGTIEVLGSEGHGGHVEILGDRVALTDNAIINASGESGGGQVFIGGDYQGKNPEVKNAQQTYVGATTLIKADAITSGDGGKIIVWADETTQFYGEISAKGGNESGDGGFIETSGKEYLEVTGQANASAVNGTAGEWLLDPNNIIIQTGSDTAITGNPAFTTTNDSSILTTGTIETALNAGTSVTVTTASLGTNSQAGDITVNNTITKSAGVNASLTLNADNNININANITSTVGVLNVTLDANRSSGSGAINFSTSPRTINTNGGTFSTSGDTVNVSNGLIVDGSWVNTGTVNWSGSIFSDDFTINTGTFTNQGSFNITTTTPTAAILGTGIFSNEGTVTKLVISTIDTTVTTVFNSISGSTVDVEGGAGELLLNGGGAHAGTLTFANQGPSFNGGTHTFAGGTTISGGGVSFTGGVVAQFDTSATTISTTNLTFDNVTLQGAGSLTTAAGSTTALDRMVLDTDWLGQGTVNWSGALFSNDFTINTGMTFTNQGNFNVNVTTSAAVLQGAGTFNNTGTLSKAIGGGINIQTVLTNTGTVNITSGQLNFTNFTANSGTIDIAAGTFDVNSNFTNNSGATIQGSGIYDTSGNTLTNNGTILAGTSPGTLTITGNLVLGASSVLDIELNGTATPGTDYDLIDVSGDVTLGGTLNVIEFGGFTASAGNTFDFINYGTFTASSFATINSNFGDFHSVSTPGAGSNFRLTMTANGLFVFWDGGGGDLLWSNALNWSGDALPLITEDVLIDPTGAITIEVTGAGRVARQLSMPGTVGTDNLTVKGSLTLDGVFSTAGDLLLDSFSAMSVNGDVTVGGNFTSAGTGSNLQSTGDVTVTGITTFNHNASIGSGGTLFANGGFNITSPFNMSIGRTIQMNGGTWSGGGNAITGGGKLINTAGNTLLATNTSSYTLSVELENLGTLTKSGTGDFVITGGLTNNNIVNINNGTLQLDNIGTVTGTFNIGTGNTLFLQSGTMTFDSGSIVTGAGNLSIAGSGTTNAIFSTGSTYTLTGSTSVNSFGTITFNDNVSLSSLDISGGALLGTGDVTVSGLTTKSGGGQIGGAGTTLFANGGFNVSGGNNFSLARTIQMNGGSWSGSGGFNNGGGKLVNNIGNTLSVNNTGADFDINLELENLGILTKTGTGDFVINGGLTNNNIITANAGTLRLDNAGTVTGAFNVSTGGTLLLTGASTIFDGSSSITGTGDLQIASGGTSSATFSSGSTYTLSGSTTISSFGTATFNDNVTLSSLTLAGSGSTLQGTGDVTVSGLTSVTNSAVIGGAGTTLFANGGFDISSPFNMSIGRTIEMNGGAWSGGGNAITGAGKFVNNVGNTLTANTSGFIVGVVFDNNGALLKTSGTNLSLNAGGTHTGSFTSNGGTIDFGAGTHTFSATSSFTGSSIIDFGTTNTIASGASYNVTGTTLLSAGTLNFNTTGSTNTFTHSGGVLDGSGSLTVNNTWTPTSGVTVDGNLILGSLINKGLPSAPPFILNGTGTLINQGILTFTNSTINTKFDNQGTLRVANNWSSFINGTVVGNSGTIDFLGTGNPTNLTIANGFSSDGTIQLTRGTLTISAGTLINNGTIQSTGAAGSVFNGQITNLGTLDLDAALTLNNSGFFRSDAGTIDVASGQIFTVNGGTTQLGTGTGFLGTGTMDMIGTPTIDLLSDLTWPASSVVLTLGLGSVTTIQSLAGATFINQGVLNLTNDIIDADIDNQGTLQAANNWSSFINGAVVGNSGTIDFLGVGNPTILTIANGFSSDGTIDLTRGTLTISAGTLINNGTIQSTGAAGSILNAQVTNNGIIDLNIALQITNGSRTFTQNSGSIDLGANLTFSGGGNFDWAGGTIQNTGSFLGGPTLNISGSGTRILNGPSLTFNNATFNGGSLEVQSGTFNATGTTTVSSNATFSNTGGTFNLATLAVNSGSTLFMPSGTIPVSGLTTIASGAVIDVSGGTFQPTTLTLDGTLSGSSNVTISGLTSWNDGVMSGTGTTFADGGIELDGFFANRAINRDVEHSGTHTWSASGSIPGTGTLTHQSGTLTMDSQYFIDSPFVNNATVVIDVAAALIGFSDVQNNGTMQINNGTFRIDGNGNNTTGIFTIASGAILLFRNDYVFNGGSVSGLGTLELDGSHFDVFTGSSISPQTLTLTDGSFHVDGGTGSIGGATTIDFNTEIVVTTGSFSSAAGITNNGLIILDVGSLTLNAGATHSGDFNIGAGAVLQFNGGTHTLNSGSDTFGAGDIAFTNGTATYDTGSTYNISGDTGINGGNAVFNIDAVTNTLTHASGSFGSGSTGSITTSGWIPTNGVTMNDISLILAANGNNTLTGITINSAGTASITNQGTLTLDNSTINPALDNLGTLIIIGTTNINSPVFDFTSGILSLTAGSTLNKNGGDFNWIGGAIGSGSGDSGSIVMLGGANFNLIGATTRVLNGPTVTINNLVFPGGSLEVQSGSLNMTGATTIAVPATFSNTGGTFNLASLTVSGVGSLTVPSGTINASGTSNINSGSVLSLTGGTFNSSGPLNNNGLLQLQAGTVALAGGGTHTGDFSTSAGTLLQFNGGTHTFNSGSDTFGAGDIAFTNGTATYDTGSTYTVSGDTGINGGDAIFNIDAITNTLTHVSGSFGGGSTGSITTSGWMPTSGITLSDIALILAANGNNTLTGIIINSAGTASVTNQGTLTLDNSTINPALSSLGVLNIKTGSTNTVAGTLNILGGTLTGGGTLISDVNNTGGTLASGDSPGTLTITGNYTQGAGGTFLAELAGAGTAGSDYDLLSVTGTATLDGILDIQLFGAYTGIDGDQFDIISSADVINDFATINSPTGLTFTASADTPVTGTYQLEIPAAIVVVLPPEPTPTPVDPPLPEPDEEIIDIGINQLIVLNEYQDDAVVSIVEPDADDDDEEEERELVCR